MRDSSGRRVWLRIAMWAVCCVSTDTTLRRINDNLHSAALSGYTSIVEIKSGSNSLADGNGGSDSSNASRAIGGDFIMQSGRATKRGKYTAREEIVRQAHIFHPCRPTPTTVRLSFPDMKEQVLVSFLGYKEPNLVVVNRCKGLCPASAAGYVACIPVRRRWKRVNMQMQVQILGHEQRQTGVRQLILEEHTDCGCQCLSQTAKHCVAPHLFDTVACACRCPAMVHGDAVDLSSHTAPYEMSSVQGQMYGQTHGQVPPPIAVPAASISSATELCAAFATQRIWDAKTCGCIAARPTPLVLDEADMNNIGRHSVLPMPQNITLVDMVDDLALDYSDDDHDESAGFGWPSNISVTDLARLIDGDRSERDSRNTTARRRGGSSGSRQHGQQLDNQPDPNYQPTPPEVSRLISRVLNTDTLQVSALAPLDLEEHKSCRHCLQCLTLVAAVEGVRGLHRYKMDLADYFTTDSGGVSDGGGNGDSGDGHEHSSGSSSDDQYSGDTADSGNSHIASSGGSYQFTSKQKSNNRILPTTQDRTQRLFFFDDRRPSIWSTGATLVVSALLLSTCSLAATTYHFWRQCRLLTRRDRRRQNESTNDDANCALNTSKADEVATLTGEATAPTHLNQQHQQQRHQTRVSTLMPDNFHQLQSQSLLQQQQQQQRQLYQKCGDNERSPTYAPCSQLPPSLPPINSSGSSVAPPPLFHNFMTVTSQQEQHQKALSTKAAAMPPFSSGSGGRLNASSAVSFGHRYDASEDALLRNNAQQYGHHHRRHIQRLQHQPLQQQQQRPHRGRRSSRRRHSWSGDESDVDDGCHEQSLLQQNPRRLRHRHPHSQQTQRSCERRAGSREPTDDALLAAAAAVAATTVQSASLGRRTAKTGGLAMQKSLQTTTHQTAPESNIF